jgi:protein-L-isoaspartate(D-aspartate) O-methyltransferase
MTEDVAAIRRWFAEDLRLRTPVTRNLAVVEAFATVPRERLLAGDGPWQLISFNRLDLPFTTPDAAPHWLYHDVLVAIDPARELNNGAPSFWAHNFDHVDLKAGERVLQVGAGTGYYSALLAEMVGPKGRVVAVEYEPELAERARANLAPWRQVEVVAGDGRTHDAGEFDAIVVFAGSTHPAPLWLDRLAEGGRLLMPLTGGDRRGFMLRAIRRGDAFEAASIGWVGIYPCMGGRDDEAAGRLWRTLLSVAGKSGRDIPICALHRGAPEERPTDRVWYHGPDFWLERAPPPAETTAAG